MDIMPMNLQTEGKQNPVFAPFNQAIESGDVSRIYKVIVPIIRGYYFSYTKNPSRLENVVAVIAERFFRVMKEHPDMSPNYYWGVIKKGVLWELYSICKHKNDIFLSELLDVEDHRYPESMMKSVSELYRESAKSLGKRRVRRVLEDAANSFMTAEDIMAAYNLSRYEVYSLLRKYQITIIPFAKKCVVAIMSASPMWRTDKASEEFRSLVKSFGGTLEELPEGAFKESGTNVKTCLVVVRK